MGAWGVRFVENDGALDFLGELGDSREWATVHDQLESYVEDGGYEDGQEAFAAAEIVAAALGKASPVLDAAMVRWAEEQSAQAAGSLELAIQAAELIATESEINELWSETDDYADWQASVEDLKSRLGSVN